VQPAAEHDDAPERAYFHADDRLAVFVAHRAADRAESPDRDLEVADALTVGQVQLMRRSVGPLAAVRAIDPAGLCRRDRERALDEIPEDEVSLRLGHHATRGPWTLEGHDRATHRLARGGVDDLADDQACGRSILAWDRWRRK
jgi:hypothetical protein